MSIRILEKEDYYKNYLELLNQLRSFKKYDFNNFQNILKSINYNDNHNIFVIEKNDLIVGTTTLILEKKFIYGGNTLGHIEDVVVHKDYRNKGYGSKLIDYCIDYCKKNNCAKIGLCSRNDSQEFYLKKGFNIIGNSYSKYF